MIALLFSLLFALAFLLTPSPLWTAFEAHPTLGYVLVSVLSVVGAWTLSNLLVPLQILKQLVLQYRPKSRDKLRAEGQLMQCCINCLDAFDGQRQTRLVVVLDALESIYESDRLMSFLEAVNINFLSCKSNAYPTVPFILILTLDPHHHVTAKSKEYLKTIVHLPFYLQNSQLRRVKIAQQVESSQVLVQPVALPHSGSIKFGPTGLQKPRPRKGESCRSNWLIVFNTC